jgi:hypothetical protein
MFSFRPGAQRFSASAPPAEAGDTPFSSANLTPELFKWTHPILGRPSAKKEERCAINGESICMNTLHFIHEKQH